MDEQYEHVKQSLYFERFTRTAGSFEAALWNLFDCADWRNKQKLGQGFPVHYAVYLDWYNCKGGEREFFKEYINEKE